MNEKKRVSICIPLTDNIKSDFFLNFLDVINSNISKYDLNLNFSKRFPIDAARNELVEKALENNPDYLWFIDSDMLIPPETLDNLISSGKEIVSALYFHKKPVYRPVVLMMKDNKYKLVDYVKLNTLLEVDVVGMGCCLIKREVFERLKERGYKNFFEFKNINLDFAEQLGEDTVFCENSKKEGFKIYLNTSVVCKHIGEILVDEKFSYLFLKNMGIIKE